METTTTYDGNDAFTLQKKSLIYINGYEVIVSRGSAAAGEGLLYSPYISGRIPVEWSGLTIKKSTDVGTDGNHYGCVTAGEVIAQGSNGTVLTQDLNRQLMALLTQGPGSFSGKFGEALDKYQQMVDDIASGKLVPTPDDLETLVGVSKATNKLMNGKLK